MVNNIHLIQIPVHAKFILKNDFGILEHLLLGGNNSLKYKERHFQSAVLSSVMSAVTAIVFLFSSVC